MEKDVNERFERIETTLDRVGERLDRLTERTDKFEVTLELQNHGANERMKKMEEMQIVLMDAQNSTWAAVNTLTANIEKLLRGRASTALVDMARNTPDNLVAMTTHGRSGLSRWVLGSIAEKVLRVCPCPVLVYRTAGFAETPAETGQDR